MAQNSMIVPPQPPHMVYRGGSEVGEKYDKTIKLGNTTVHIVSPSISEEEKQRRIASLNRVVWNIWRSLSVERRLEINAKYDSEKDDSGSY